MFRIALGFAPTLAVALVLGLGSAWAGPTLDKIKQAGRVVCGVSTGLAGFSQPDSQGRYSGLDVDICKAIAASVLGDPDKVSYVPLTAQQRFTALQSGEIDILSRNTTATLQRDTELGLNFAPVVFYDGQGFMVPKKLGIKSVKELNGATVCVQPGTTTELSWPTISALITYNLSRSLLKSSMRSSPRICPGAATRSRPTVRA